MVMHERKKKPCQDVDPPVKEHFASARTDSSAAAEGTPAALSKSNARLIARCSI